MKNLKQMYLFAAIMAGFTKMFQDDNRSGSVCRKYRNKNTGHAFVKRVARRRAKNRMAKISRRINRAVRAKGR